MTTAQDHRLAIGEMRMDCTALAWSEEQSALRGLLDRVTSTALPGTLPAALDPVLDGIEGVVRLRRLQLDVDYFGPSDEAALAHSLAMRIAAALRDALPCPTGDTLQRWPDQATYLAAYIERRLALDRNPAPAWAFEEFATLDHLPPERAAAEMVREFPEILVSLARNANRESHPNRFALALDEASASALVDALLVNLAPPLATIDALSTALHLMDTNLRLLAVAGPARAALSLTLIMLARTDEPPLNEALGVATLAAAVLHLQDHNEIRGPVSQSTVTPSAAYPQGWRLLSPTVTALVKKHLSNPHFVERVGDILPTDQPSPPAHQISDSTVTDRVPVHLHSPVAGVGLLLPVITEFRVPDYLGPRHLHAAILSTLGTDEQALALTDPLFAALFPLDHQPLDQGKSAEPTPPVPDPMKTLVAPETLPLLTGDGANPWGDLTLAAFATRLPGLKTSSRGYLQAQFLHTAGRLTITPQTLDLTLQGPDLAIVLKMAGLNGVQRKLPHLGNRLLTITLAGLTS